LKVASSQTYELQLSTHNIVERPQNFCAGRVGFVALLRQNEPAFSGRLEQDYGQFVAPPCVALLVAARQVPPLHTATVFLEMLCLTALLRHPTLCGGMAW
jgi:hypothetical protein